MTIIKFGQICSICRNIEFACKSCYLKENKIPSNFVLKDLTKEEEEYYQSKNNLIGNYKIVFDLDEEENIDINN